MTCIYDLATCTSKCQLLGVLVENDDFPRLATGKFFHTEGHKDDETTSGTAIEPAVK